jgi:transforming growth factor-beta-induced protein
MRKLTLLLMITAVVGFTACSGGANSKAEMAKQEEMAQAKADSIAAAAEAMASMDVVATAMANENFTTLCAAVKAAGLVEALQGDGPFTIFAPTNEAFAALPAGTVENLLKPENKAKLQAILTYHVVPGKVMAADVTTMMAPTVNGKECSVVVSDAGVMVDGANVTATDIECSNGVIHVIDKVIMPKM